MQFLRSLDGVSISFVLVTLFLGTMIGSAGGSLLSRVFGFDFLNHALFAENITVISDFYLLSRITLKITPGALIGFLITAVFLYRSSLKKQ